MCGLERGQVPALASYYEFAMNSSVVHHVSMQVGGENDGGEMDWMEGTNSAFHCTIHPCIYLATCIGLAPNNFYTLSLSVLV